MILIIFSLFLLFTGTFCVFLGYGLFYFISRKVSSIYFNIFYPIIEFSILIMITCLRLAIFLFLSIYCLFPPCCFEAAGLFLSMPTVITNSYIFVIVFSCVFYAQHPPQVVLVLFCLCNFDFHLLLPLSSCMWSCL